MGKYISIIAILFTFCINIFAADAPTWETYYKWIEDYDYDKFENVDPEKYIEYFKPLLQDPKYKDDEKVLTAYSVGLINAVYSYKYKNKNEQKAHAQEAFRILDKYENSDNPYIIRELGWGYYDGIFKSQNKIKAEAFFTRELKINEKVSGAEHTATAFALNNLARLYFKMGDYQKALPLYERALKIREKMSGAEHPDTAIALNNLASSYFKMGDYQKALPLYERTLKIREKISGAEHPVTADSLNNLASSYFKMGDYQKALPLYERVLKIREKMSDAEPLDTATVIISLGEIYKDMRDYQKALQLYERSLKITEKVLGAEHLSNVLSLIQLAYLYSDMKDYQKALPLYERSLKIMEKVLGAEDPATALALNGIRLLYETVGDYQRALPFCERSLKIREKVSGAEHLDTALVLNTLANLYSGMGDYQKALPLYERALKINEKVSGAEHTDTARTLSNLALLYSEMDDYQKALPLCERALKINEKVLGADHLDTSVVQNNMACLYFDMGDYQKALPLCERALKISEKVLGTDDPATAISLSNLANLYSEMGDYQKALPFCERSLKIREKVLGAEHPDTAVSLFSLGEIYKDMGDYQNAYEYYIKSLNIINGNRENIYAISSERQRLAFEQKKTSRKVKELIINIVYRKHEEKYINSALEVILRSKARVLDSVIEDRLLLSSNPEANRKQEELKQLQKERSQLSIKIGSSDIKQEQREYLKGAMSETDEKIDKIEGELSKMVPKFDQGRRATQVTLEQVAGALPQNSILLEFSKFYLSRTASDKKDGVKVKYLYSCFIIDKNGAVKPVFLPEADEIDKSIEICRAALKEGKPLKGVLEDLSGKIWKPLEKEIPSGTKRIIISPDSEMNFLPFSILLTDDGKYLSQKYEIAYVSSGRDLIKEIAKPDKKNAEIFGDPDFGSSKDTEKYLDRQVVYRSVFRDIDRTGLESLRFPRLPGTEKEAKELKSLCDNKGLPSELYLSGDATEEKLKSSVHPNIIHLATHGFFLPDKNMGQLKSNPMLRSGIVLAGAELSIQIPPADKDDGIVTAEEISSLDLWGTDLVVLSACDTGLGDNKSGEGVMGLRRAFVQAGTKNLLMTLSPVGDETTSEIMRMFYGKFLVSGDAVKAINETQMEYMKAHPNAHPREWAPFVLSIQGNLK